MAKRAVNSEWQASRRLCAIDGKPAKFKAMVSVYPLLIEPRSTKSGDVIALCESCARPKRVSSKVQAALVAAFSQAITRVQANIEENGGDAQ